MGRLKDDFFSIKKGLGIVNSMRLVLIPRVLIRCGFKRYKESKVINRFICDNFKNIILKYRNATLSQEVPAIPSIIWVFWWQGKQNMPIVIKECYDSVTRNANGRDVVLVSEDNYQSYVSLPDEIIRKFRNKSISTTHFSDILRTKLLIDYGGLWIDAAVYVTKPIIIPSCRFFSPKVSNVVADSPHMSQWVIGVMGTSAQMPLFLYVYDLLVTYWSKYNGAFSYLMYDYFIRYGYENFSWVKKLMDERPLMSPDFFSTRYSFNNEVNLNLLNDITNNNTFLSLTWRIPYSLTTDNGKETYYSALLKNTKINQ